ncbi:putative DNA-binding protein [Desulfosporosinus sp. OT]|uniref:putative DNA-binding protein n=1 Tax=Desulfosporosinus sp. OT TaxID=913865 RepID=UPI0002239E80|nr:putative DNA-binding protein [Desulfosporosinus sp. OT]EGW38610.1 helix-turn-helix, YlxM / p13 like family protein [Desulfosporosinus sp. OT]
MEKLAKMALLADFYGPLLTEKQRNVWDLHYQQDLSLAEIAEVEHISRQAIHDLIKRTERILAEYEQKLGLVQRFWAEREKLMEVKTLSQQLQEQDFTNQSAWVRHQQLRAMIDEVYVNILDI